MDFSILGSVEAVSDGRVLPLGGPRQRALLARLLVDANRVVSADRLTADLWEAPPQDAHGALQNQVSRLRKVLGDRLVTKAPGYLVRGEPGSDPGAVAFDAIEAAKARDVDVVIVDTAGRLHTQQPLMEELRKVRKVIERQSPGAPHETLLTIDATTGQNGLRQAMLFREAVDVTGIALTKLDGTAKGGIALAIAQELGVPVKLIGVGEGIEDLRPFDPDDFARAIVGAQ